MRQTIKRGFWSSTGTWPLLLLSSHSTFWKLGISYLLFTKHNSCRSDVNLNLNFNYLIVSLPSFLLKEKFIFHFLLAHIYKGTILYVHIVKKKIKLKNFWGKMELGHF